MNAYTNIHLHKEDEPYQVMAFESGLDVCGMIDFGGHVKIYVSPDTVGTLADAVRRLQVEFDAKVQHANP